jgi:AsmA protein
MRNLKFLGVLAGGIAALLCAVLVGVWLLVNPNAYKGRIVAAVRESTGRELRLPGGIKLSVLPWVALELGPASLGNPPGFSDEPFLSFTHASVRVRLLPLLHERLEVARIEVDGLDLRLRKNAQGRGNWQTETAQPAKANADHTEAARALESLANIRIQNGRVAYEGNSIEKLNLETGSLAADRHVPVSLTFDATRAPAGAQLSLNAKFDVSDDADHQHLLFKAVNASGTLKTFGDGEPASWELSTPLLSLSVAQQMITAPAFALSYAGAHLTGSARATNIFGDFNVTGSLTLAPLVLREFAPRLAMALPKTRDPKALSQLSATANFGYDSKAMSLSALQMRLDDTQIQGSLKFLAGDTDVVTFDIAADQIDLDRYRAPEVIAANKESIPPAAQPAKSDKPLEASGTLNVKAAQFARLELANVRVAVTMKDKVTHLAPIEAQVVGGRASGELTLDNHGPTPAMSMEGQLTGIDMTRLLANTRGKRRLSGRATINLKVTAHSDTVDAMLKTLNGHLDANLVDGALEGIDVGYEIKLAQALIDRSAAPPANSTGHTPFQAFKLSAQITNGIAATRDLTIESQSLKVAGQGSANLPTRGIDFKLLASIVTAPARNTDIPLKVTGTYADPTVRPDIEAVAKDQLKQKLQDVLKKNGLQGLFSK